MVRTIDSMPMRGSRSINMKRIEMNQSRIWFAGLMFVVAVLSHSSGKGQARELKPEESGAAAVNDTARPAPFELLFPANNAVAYVSTYGDKPRLAWQENSDKGGGRPADITKT